MRIVLTVAAITVLLLFVSTFRPQTMDTKNCIIDLGMLPILTTEDLIDGLQQETIESPGTSSKPNVDEVVVIGVDFVVQWTPEPSFSPLMQELIRRGVSSLPLLLEHLTDNRSTRLVIQLRFDWFGRMYHCDQYDPRYENNNPSNVNRVPYIERIIETRNYTIRVGDLCYIAIGEIVNRRLNAVRYRPSACIMINSPVETARLATAVRQDWHGLTVDEHKRSLMLDLASPERAEAALVRLNYYYPQAIKQ
jgi:hypothetical protein